MKKLITILLFALPIICNAQQEVDSIMAKINEKQLGPISSIKQYKYIAEKYPNFSQIAWLNYKIATLYLGLRDTSNAEVYFKRTLAIKKKQGDNGDNQGSACLKMIEIKTEQKNYAEALKYLNESKTIYRPTKILVMCGSGPERRFRFGYQKSICFNGLGQIDSAIAVLGPHIFITYEDTYDDSLEFDNKAKYFASLVISKYGKEKASQLLKNAIQTTEYIPEPLSYPTQDYQFILCKTNFCNNTIETYLEIFGDDYKLYKSGKLDQKELLLTYFKSTPAYQFIMTDAFSTNY